MGRRGGWRRLGQRRFRYVDSRGRPIEDEERLERIEALTIPPAWRDVWISPNPTAKLQATGIDSAGRKQYLYSASFQAAQRREKFDRQLQFAALLPGLRASTSRHLRLDSFEYEWACAIALGVIDKTWFRVGTDRHARASRTYGVTTLTKRHVEIEGDEIRFCFRSKNRKLTRRGIRNAVLARELGKLVELDGSRLFRFRRDGELVNLTAQLLNEYLSEHLGDGFTTKDFRTWGGTLVAAVALERAGPAADGDEAQHVLARVMRKVASELGNTPAVARDSYVSPSVIEAYRAGRTISDYRGRRNATRLTADEQALLRLLRAAPG